MGNDEKGMTPSGQQEAERQGFAKQEAERAPADAPMQMKIVLGMITRQLTDPGTIVAFLDNAARFNRKIDRVIISVSGEVNPAAVRAIEARVPLEVIDLNQPEERIQAYAAGELTEAEANALFRRPVYESGGQMPYGPNRNGVILEGIRGGGDVLVFVDSDVSPLLLSGCPGQYHFEDADFFGSHLEALDLPGVGVSTSDYSGYYIIPPMAFDGLDTFLEGLQKGAAYAFVQGSGQHHGLTFDCGDSRQPFWTDKILGGNVAIRLELFQSHLPFFSTAYHFEGDWVLTRGEDTLLGKTLAASERWKVLDIDLRIFHDTFGTFPQIPDIQKEAFIRNRFYNTCLGWIGRNPILNALSGEDAGAISRRQIAFLEKSVAAAAEYFGDARFLKLPDAARAAFEQLPDALEAYAELRRLWPKAVRTAWKLRDEARGVEDGGVNSIRSANSISGVSIQSRKGGETP
ncbi:hypothetical protein [Acidaminobacter hydrogenoformans]|uniref:Glycosyl transferase family 2 n=1 Tax=Acidaminobacter hydrogenoformans DSM 2784 TaxID=1120920 RepID=A0A1G5RS03_9FIRM|nr:hypothetical protein [Acidaminobacter hydrogenoformans]SCZ76211.1 hypothetical protein SAMN03080599_00124 [Acidaminobacter hydrogenoformans DSM 2784]